MPAYQSPYESSSYTAPSFGSGGYGSYGSGKTSGAEVAKKRGFKLPVLADLVGAGKSGGAAILDFAIDGLAAGQRYGTAVTKDLVEGDIKDAFMIAPRGIAGSAQSAFDAAVDVMDDKDRGIIDKSLGAGLASIGDRGLRSGEANPMFDREMVPSKQLLPKVGYDPTAGEWFHGSGLSQAIKPGNKMIGLAVDVLFDPINVLSGGITRVARTGAEGGEAALKAGVRGAGGGTPPTPTPGPRPAMDLNTPPPPLAPVDPPPLPISQAGSQTRGLPPGPGTDLIPRIPQPGVTGVSKGPLDSTSPFMDPMALPSRTRIHDDVYRGHDPKLDKYDPSPEAINARAYHHGTATKGLDETNLDSFLTDPKGLFGQGVYTTTNPKVSDDYAKAALPGGHRGGLSKGIDDPEYSHYRASLDVKKPLDMHGRPDPDHVEAVDEIAKKTLARLGLEDMATKVKVQSNMHRDNTDVFNSLKSSIPNQLSPEIIRKTVDEPVLSKEIAKKAHRIRKLADEVADTSAGPIWNSDREFLDFLTKNVVRNREQYGAYGKFSEDAESMKEAARTMTRDLALQTDEAGDTFVNKAVEKRLSGIIEPLFLKPAAMSYEKAAEKFEKAKEILKSDDLTRKVHEDYVKTLRAKGYDAITHTGGQRMGGFGEHQVVIALDSATQPWEKVIKKFEPFWGQDYYKRANAAAKPAPHTVPAHEAAPLARVGDSVPMDPASIWQAKKVDEVAARLASGGERVGPDGTRVPREWGDAAPAIAGAADDARKPWIMPDPMRVASDSGISSVRPLDDVPAGSTVPPRPPAPPRPPGGSGGPGGVPDPVPPVNPLDTLQAGKAATAAQQAAKLADDEAEIARVAKDNPKTDATKFQLKVLGKDAGSVTLKDGTVMSAIAKHPKTLGAVVKAGDTLTKPFRPGAGDEKSVYHGLNASGSLASAASNQTLRDFRSVADKVKTPGETESIGAFLIDSQGKKNIDDILDDTKRPGLLSGSDGLAARYDSLSDEGKETVRYMRQFLDARDQVEVAKGLRGKEQAIKGYHPLVAELLGGPRAGKNFDVSVDPFFNHHRDLAGKSIDPKDFDWRDSFARRVMASDLALRHRSVLEDAATRFGKTAQDVSKMDPAERAKWVKVKEGTQASKIMGDSMVPRDVAHAVDTLYDVYSRPEYMDNIMKYVQGSTRFFKNAAYTLNPGHLSTDHVGNMWNMWLENGKAMQRAARNPLTMRRRYKEAAKLIDYHNNPAKYAGKLDLLENKIMLHGKAYRLDELQRVAVAERIMDSSQAAAELGVKGGKAARGKASISAAGAAQSAKNAINPKNIKQTGRNAMANAQAIGAYNDNLSKMFGYLAYAAHAGKKVTREATEDAALRQAAKGIRKSTFAYNDLTAFERNVMRNVIPFYTWTRKNLPFQAQKMIEQPGKVSAVFKTQDYMEDNSGINIDAESIPEYARNNMFVAGNAGPGKIRFMNAGIPTMDLTKYQSNKGVSGNDLLSELNPLIKAIPELSSGKKLGTNIPIESGAPRYLASSFLGPTGSNIKKGQDARGGSTDSNFNLYAGLYKQFIGPLGITEKEISKLDTGAQLTLKDAIQKKVNRLQKQGLIPNDEQLKRR